MTGAWYRRPAGALLRRAVRRGAERGGEWGEAMLAEYEHASGWAAIRWAVSGAWFAWRGARPAAGRAPGPARPPVGAPYLRLALAVLAGLGLSLAGSQAFALGYVPSVSMEPSVRVGDRLLMDEVGFRLDGLEHGDVITYELAGRRYLKRIIGLPGDRITCAGGAVFRNGERLVEGYLAPDTVTECAPVTVPDGAVYALGDNRFFSKDSRHQGTIDGDRVTGRLITTFRLPFGQGPPAPASPASR